MQFHINSLFSLSLIVQEKENEEDIDQEMDGKHMMMSQVKVISYLWNFPGGSAVKNPPADAGGMGLIPGLGRNTGE